MTPSGTANPTDVGRSAAGNWPEIGAKSAETRPEMDQNGAKRARFRGGLSPSGVGQSAVNRRRRTERRLRITESNDSNEEGRPLDRPGAGPRAAGSDSAGSRDLG